MRAVAAFLVLMVLAGSALAAFFLLSGERVFEVVRSPDTGSTETKTSFAPSPSPAPRRAEPLPDPPRVVKAVYATNWSAGNANRMETLIDLINSTELNAIVIDIKDFSGIVGYATDVAEAVKYGASERRIRDLAGLLIRLHDKNIYVIGRLAVFQDQKLVVARPDLAVGDGSGKPWRDRKGLTWIDPTARDAWKYNVEIARDALRQGFDEINFDYIRFPSDGNLATMEFPFWSASTTRPQALGTFFEYVSRELKDAHISADLFGLSAVETGDMGIGQKFETALPHFVTIAPMFYPSHYHSGFVGFREPALHPYEVVRASVDSALGRMRNALSPKRATSTPLVSAFPSRAVYLRPWLQDFDLGGTYDATRVRDEIEAVYDAFLGRKRGSNTASTSPLATPSFSCGEDVRSEFYGGWMLWSPENVYTKAALCP